MPAPDPRPAASDHPRRVVVVGAGLAGLSTVRALRRRGYAGALTVVGTEPHRPYDRPPLSKEILTGTLTEADLSLERRGEDLGAEWLLGRAAARLETGPDGHRVLLADGGVLEAEAAVIATGARARTLAGADRPLAGVHTLRTLEDARALSAELRPGARMVVIGAGFIGSEVASAGRVRGLEVTVLEATDSPLSVPLGAEAGGLVAGLHAEHGVTLRLEAPVTGLRGTDRVTGVELAGGEVVPADLVVLGIGAVPDVDWLVGSGVGLGPGGVRCDRSGATTVPGVFAVGDCACWWDPLLDRHHRVEHWTDAKDRPLLVAARLLDGELSATVTAPYFWSDQYGTKIQFAGRRHGDETLVVEHRDPSGLLATYRRGETVTAVLAVGRQPEFMRLRKRLAVEINGPGA